MGKSHKDEKITRLIIEGELPRKPKKPRNLGSGFHGNKSDRRKNTRSAQLRADLEFEEDEDDREDF